VELAADSSETNLIERPTSSSTLTQHKEPDNPVSELHDTPPSPDDLPLPTNPSPPEEFFETMGESFLDWMFPDSVEDNLYCDAGLYSKPSHDNRKQKFHVPEPIQIRHDPSSKYYGRRNPGDPWTMGWTVSPGRRFEFPPPVQISSLCAKERHASH